MRSASLQKIKNREESARWLYCHSAGHGQAGVMVGEGNLRKFSKGKCQVLPLGGSKPLHPSVLGADRLESNFAGKDLGVLVDTS